MKMDKGIKAVIVGVIAVIHGFLGNMAIPVYVLVACNVIDYATGLLAAPKRGEKPNSYKGLAGIAKKVCMWLLIIVGALVDELIIYAASTIRPDFREPFLVAVVVAVWLAFNEMISILENMRDIGVALPPFILPLIKMFKKKTEEVVSQATKTEDGKANEAEASQKQ